MKKLMFLTAAAACGAALAVESANIVGYKTFTLNKEYTLIGICFDSVKTTGMTLDDVAPYTEGNGMTKAYATADADNIQVMGDDGKYTNYFLSNGQWGKGGTSYNKDLDGKWIKTAGAANTDTVKAGQAFWYVSRTAATTPQTITIAGQVLETSETPVKNCTATYTLLANPYACGVPINGNVVATGTTKAYATSDADNIQVMGDDGKYTNYFLSNGQWGKGGTSYNKDLDGKWLRTAGADCADEIPAGAAFWYVSRSGESTVKLINPLAE